MLGVFLLEPGANHKKRQLAYRVMPIGSEAVPKLEDVKRRLREIRHHSITNRQTLTDHFISNIKQKKNVDLFVACTPDQAAKKIEEISGAYPLVVNKSAVISSELKSILLSRGMRVEESYYNEFSAFENRFSDFRMLPKLEFESIWNSFSSPEDLIHYRQEQAQVQGYGRYAGLLGVNAVSAQEGAVVFLQHLQNIRSIVTQAEVVILVATLDKIVNSYNEALFQAKCMATFGAESLPLTLKKPHNGVLDFKNLPRIQAGPSSNTIHMILLDNDRTRLLDREEKELLTCIGCRACLRVCPASEFFSTETRLSPKDYIYAFLSGSIPSVDKCIQCKSCRTACPLEINIPKFIREARINGPNKARPVADRLLARADFFEKIGSVAPRVSNAAYENKVLRWAGEKIAGISRKRNIPTVQRFDLERWLNESENSDADRQ